MSAPQRIQPIVVMTDLWNDCEREAARWADAPEPNVPSDPVLWRNRHKPSSRSSPISEA